MSLIKPRAIAPGATIGIVSPSSPVNQAELEAGIELITARGYRVVCGPHVLDKSARFSYLAGDDAARAADLNSMFANPKIDAVLCARGGYGCIRLLDRIDWPTVLANPKLFIGYSDITTMHMAIARLGIGTVHGPMVCAHSRLSPVVRDQFWSVLETTEAAGVLPTDNAAVATVVGGVAGGEIAGGCLSLLAQSLGSQHGPDFDGKIVLIEDVGEAVYRADRNLWQLRNAGLFDRAAGFVLGSLTNWQKFEADPPENRPETLFAEFFESLGKPTISGFPFGHEPDPFTLPLGVKAELDADSKTLTLLEAVVCG